MSPLAAYLVGTLITLFAIVTLAFLVIYAARRLGVGQPAGPLELVGRLPIDARRAIYLVRVGELVYVVGASDGGLTKLGELGAEGLSIKGGAERGRSFAELFSPTRRASEIVEKRAVDPSAEEGADV